MVTRGIPERVMEVGVRHKQCGKAALEMGWHPAFEEHDAPHRVRGVVPGDDPEARG